MKMLLHAVANRTLHRTCCQLAADYGMQRLVAVSITLNLLRRYFVIAPFRALSTPSGWDLGRESRRGG